MRLARKLHLFFGVFFAPSIIFFAVSGFFQTFSWHEEHDGKPPIALAATIAEIHMNQRTPNPEPPAPTAIATPPAQSAPPSTPVAAPPSASASPAQTAAAAPAKAEGAPRPPRRKKSFPLKIFMGFMSLGLIGSSLVGIWMGFQVNRDPRLVLGLLLAGTMIPIVALYAGM